MGFRRVFTIFATWFMSSTSTKVQDLKNTISKKEEESAQPPSEFVDRLRELRHRTPVSDTRPEVSLQGRSRRRSITICLRPPACPPAASA